MGDYSGEGQLHILAGFLRCQGDNVIDWNAISYSQEHSRLVVTGGQQLLINKVKIIFSTVSTIGQMSNKKLSGPQSGGKHQNAYIVHLIMDQDTKNLHIFMNQCCH